MDSPSRIRRRPRNVVQTWKNDHRPRQLSSSQHHYAATRRQQQMHYHQTQKLEFMQLQASGHRPMPMQHDAHSSFARMIEKEQEQAALAKTRMGYRISKLKADENRSVEFWKTQKFAAVDFINKRVKALKEQARKEVDTAVREGEARALKMKTEFKVAMEFQNEVTGETEDPMRKKAKVATRKAEKVAAAKRRTEAVLEALTALPKALQAEREKQNKIVLLSSTAPFKRDECKEEFIEQVEAYHQQEHAISRPEMYSEFARTRSDLLRRLGESSESEELARAEHELHKKHQHSKATTEPEPEGIFFKTYMKSHNLEKTPSPCLAEDVPARRDRIIEQPNRVLPHISSDALSMRRPPAPHWSSRRIRPAITNSTATGWSPWQHTI